MDEFLEAVPQDETMKERVAELYFLEALELFMRKEGAVSPF